MKRFTLRFAITLLGFIIGVSAVTVWLLAHQEEPPCRSCAQVYSLASPELETISFSDLVANPENFKGRIVRVRGNLNNDAGYKSLYAPAPKDEGMHLMAEFNDRSSYSACDGVRKALRDIAGIGHWKKDGSAGVVVVGRLGELDHFWRGKFGFEILCVEQAYPLGAEMP